MIAGIVRMDDKMSRLISLNSKKEQQVMDESLRDTLMDLANYAIMSVMWLDEQWHKVVTFRTQFNQILIKAPPQLLKCDFCEKNGGGHEPLVHQRFRGGQPRRHKKKHIVA